MGASSYPDLFNDVFGPVMQPGSSSHTAGPCRMGVLARRLLGEEPAGIRVRLDPQGSFAGTFGLMAEDSAMIAGALGLLPDDPRLFDAAELARNAGVSTEFVFAPIPETDHPNAMAFHLAGRSGKQVVLTGDSIGGGMVETRTIDGFELRFRGDGHLVLVFDPDGDLPPGAVRDLAASLGGLTRQGRAGVPGRSGLHWFHCAEPPDPGMMTRLAGGRRADIIAPILPVLDRPDRRPPLFTDMAGWRRAAAERGEPLWRTVAAYEAASSGWPFARVWERMQSLASVMGRQARAVYDEDIRVPVSPFKTDLAAQWSAHRDSGRRLTDDLTARIIQWSCGAGSGVPGVPTVPGPMGSGGGYLYAALDAVRELRGWSGDRLVRGLFVAGGVALVAFFRTEPTGETIGCTGECGICGAMAAAALADMAGGDPGQVEAAASLSLQSATGLPCDPIPGGQGQPCKSRIITAACMAPVFADLALAGHQAVLPLDEAIDVADAVGRGLPSALRCTAEGGAAAAPAARARAKAFRDWFSRERAAGRKRPPGNLI